MSISKKHNYITFTKRLPASLLHSIENILNHSSWKCCASLTMAALNFTKSTGLCTISIHQYLLSNSVIISSIKDDANTSSSFSSRTSLWYSKRLCLLDNYVKQLCLFQIQEIFYPPVNSDKAIWLP